jgi:Anti-sigma-K factor rskA, C-terminal/Putative zinc-finger
MTPCLEYRESIAAFVLGALPPAEVTPLRAHLAGCEECDRYHDEMMALPPLLDMAGGVDGLAIEAPAGLEDRSARQIAAEGASRKRPRRLRRPLLAGAGGLALGAAATLGIVFALGGFSGTASADAVDLAGTPSAPSAWGTADLKAGPHGTTIRLDADGLPPSKPGYHYEVWLTDGRHGISAGTFRVGADGKARCTLGTAGRAEYFHKVDVTVEPDVPPTTKHDSQIVLLGDI